MSDATDVRVVCTVCGQRSRRHRADLVVRGDVSGLSDRPPATTIDVCHGCTAAAGYPGRDVRRKHFVDLERDA